MSKIEKLPIVIVNDRVLPPYLTMPVEIITEDYLQLLGDLEYLDEQDRYVCVIFGSCEINKVGTKCLIIGREDYKDRTRLLSKGINKVIIKDFGQTFVEVEEVRDTDVNNQKMKALIPQIVSHFSNLCNKAGNIPIEMVMKVKALRVDSLKNINLIINMVAHYIDISNEQRYEILSMQSLLDRANKLMKHLIEKIEMCNLGEKLARDTKEEINKRNKDYYLKTQRELIDKQLNKQSSYEKEESEAEEYERRVEERGLPEEALKEARGEIKRIKRMHPASHEYSIILTYLDWILDFPWNESTKDKLDITGARKKLDDDHYGLEKPKKRILEYLAVRQLNPESRSPILCFAGKPGTGKTSISKSIADAMGRKFQRISVGGVDDATTIIGFKKTYLGSMPGRIIQAVKRAGTNNPIIAIDEIDKLGQSHRGDPASALLEALDPEQNDKFVDHYINVAVDLSKVIFITTANFIERIPPALKDRMEIINFPGYSQYEKEKIAEQFLIPKQILEHGLSQEQISFSKGALDEIINGYTKESGVRNLEREIANICRGVTCRIIEEDLNIVSVSKSNVKRYLDIPRFETKDDIEITKPGLAIGMFAGTYGGGVLFIEAINMPKLGRYPKFTTSGSLGNVINESITVAMSLIRSNRNVSYFYNNYDDIHVHVPEGAMPIEGPSAGVAILTALYSLFTSILPKEKLAMTGEITLRGKVLPIGGLKEKVLGAHRAGIKHIILPKRNEKNLKDIPKDVKNDIEFYPVDKIEEVLKIVFEGG